jgi:hypothetical protein
VQASLLNVVGQTHELPVSVSEPVSALATNPLPLVAHLEQNSLVSVDTVCSRLLLMVSATSILAQVCLRMPRTLLSLAPLL